MGKRSDFERVDKDLYRTPYKAMLPLLPLLQPATRFIDPCADAGRIAVFLEMHGHTCVGSYDIEPRASHVKPADACATIFTGADWAITNPPWDRKVLHAIIENLVVMQGFKTWLLFDADWMHTKAARPYLRYCHSVVPIGRVKWIPGSRHGGMDNCCWYLFDLSNFGYPRFVYNKE